MNILCANCKFYKSLTCYNCIANMKEFHIGEIVNKQGVNGIVKNIFISFIEVEVTKYGTLEYWMLTPEAKQEIIKQSNNIDLSSEELQIILKIPSVYDFLYAKMIVEQIGTKERRNEIMHYSDKLRIKLGLK